MGFPSSSVEGLYRNNQQDVVRFLESRHKSVYKVYNLCSEKAYDPTIFDNRVERFPFNDHNPCPFEMIMGFCRSVEEWMNQNPSNVAAIHCKAGKGRTGLMICCYMVYSGMHKTADASLEYYARRRTKDSQGVTIPSQIRYVKYFGDSMSRAGAPPFPRQALYIDKVVIHNPPKGFGPILYKIKDKHDSDVLLYKQTDEQKVVDKKLELPTVQKVVYLDDLKFIFKEKKALSPTQKDLFHFWINTCFISDNRVIIQKLDIDRLHRDYKHKDYPKDFAIEIKFSPAPYPETSMPVTPSETGFKVRDAEDHLSEHSDRDSDEFTEQPEDVIGDLEKEYSKTKIK
jgi:phosphatidylinositol-3,4,5-trisphosphate 3-phosphatase/dual-specificity protein phosphatase PTEN